MLYALFMIAVILIAISLLPIALFILWILLPWALILIGIGTIIFGISLLQSDDPTGRTFITTGVVVLIIGGGIAVGQYRT